MFKKAEKKNLKLKLALIGWSGSGKSYSALTIAKGLGEKICLIDTENSACCVYADKFEFDYTSIEPPYTSDKFINAIQEAEKLNYDVIIIDSLTHTWEGEGGVLEKFNEIEAEKPKRPQNWNIAKADYKLLKRTLFNSKLPIIATIRSKSSFMTKEINDPVAEPRIEFDFTTVFVLQDGAKTYPVTIDKTELFSNQVFIPTFETGKKFRKWLDDSFEVSEREIQYVKQLLREIEWSNENFKDYLQKDFGLSFAKLNKDQYDICIQFLKDQIKLKKTVEKDSEVSND